MSIERNVYGHWWKSIICQDKILVLIESVKESIGREMAVCVVCYMHVKYSLQYYIFLNQQK